MEMIWRKIPLANSQDYKATPLELVTVPEYGKVSDVCACAFRLVLV